jgi:hypothetical protein
VEVEMTMNPGWMKWLVSFTMAFLLVSCGGGGGGGETGGGSGISGKVPYLVSGPSVTFAVSAWNPAMYDVTVTLEADGPTGVAFTQVLITHETPTGDFAFLDLVNTPGTKRWIGTTYYATPLSPGQYRIDDIHLDDGDFLTADPLRSGWYMVMDIFSTSMYYVDERIMSGMNFQYYGGGLTSKPVRRFTLP